MDERILNISKEDIAEIITMNGSRKFMDTQNTAEDPPSFDDAAEPSIDDQFDFRRSTPIQNRKWKPRWESRDEYSVYRDEDGFARAKDGRIIHVSKEDIRAILQRATIVGRTHIGLPEYAVVSIRTVPDEASYSKAEIDEMVAEIYRVLRTSDDYHSKRLDDIYYPFDNSISWLTTRTDEMKQDIAMIQNQHAVGAGASKLIGGHTQPSIDARTRTSIDAQLVSFKDRLQSFTYMLDGVYYPLRDDIDLLTTHMNALQQEIDTTQRQLDFQA